MPASHVNRAGLPGHCYSMLMPPPCRTARNLFLVRREGKRVNYHDNGDTGSGADSGHCTGDGQDDFPVSNENGEALIS